jgi:hypothetical protein
MKVKLLKKVRKRFRLQHIEHVDYNEFSTQYGIFKQIGFKPFYFAYDNDTEYGCTYHTEKQPCLDWILGKVRNEYQQKIKANRDKITNVKF